MLRDTTKEKNIGWILLWVSMFLFLLVGLINILNRGYSVAEKNVLTLSLAFNDIDNSLNTFLTSRRMEGLGALKASKVEFDSLLNKIKNNEAQSVFEFLPRKVNSFIAGSDLSKFDFSKINIAWGESQQRMNFIISKSEDLAAFQTAIENTQAKNKVMQDDYKDLISFLVDNYFSGTKVAVIQRQPWLADRISLRLLWLQRPLAFSPQSIEVLKSESGLFDESAIKLLDQQLGEVALESQELNGILNKTKKAISEYTAELKKVAEAGDHLIKIKMHSAVHNTHIEAVDESVKETVGTISRDIKGSLLGSVLSKILFILALLLAFLSLYKLRKSWKNIQDMNAQLLLENNKINSNEVEKQADERRIEIQSDVYTESNISEGEMNQPASAVQELDFDELVSDIDKIQAGNLNVELDAKHPVWGDIAMRVNQLVAMMKQLVQAVDTSAEETAMIADERNLFNDNNLLAGEKFEKLQQQSQLMVERLKVLDLNLKIKLGSPTVGKKAVTLVASDVEKLKLICESLNQELENLLDANKSVAESQVEQSKLFDGLQELSIKLKAIASRFDAA